MSTIISIARALQNSMKSIGLPYNRLGEIHKVTISASEFSEYLNTFSNDITDGKSESFKEQVRALLEKDRKWRTYDFSLNYGSFIYASYCKKNGHLKVMYTTFTPGVDDNKKIVQEISFTRRSRTVMPESWTYVSNVKVAFGKIYSSDEVFQGENINIESIVQEVASSLKPFISSEHAPKNGFWQKLAAEKASNAGKKDRYGIKYPYH